MWKLLVYVFLMTFVICGAHATWTPDGTETPEQKAWFQKAETTPEARARLGWTSCCASADRYKTTFKYEEKEAHWYFYRGEILIQIPEDVIHWEVDPTMPKQLKAEGVLFVVGGVIACFWPPETGG